CVRSTRWCRVGEVGLVLRYLSGRVFVLDLTPGGQAHVDNFIRPGDIIDEINGTSLRNSKNGQAGAVLSRLKGLPLSIGVLRWRAGDGTVFRPLVKLLRNLKTENPSLQLGPQTEPHTEPEEQNPSQCLKDGRQEATATDADPPRVSEGTHGIVYIVQFLGKANIGMHGGKEVLQHAITQVLQEHQQSKEVLLDLKETHLTCTDRSSKQELLEHHYPEISCVGRYGQPDYTVFRFLRGRLPRNPAVDGAQSIRECEDMVCRIATGFKHTEWFV
ncbi:hypothetical protein KUCAC02_035838, partial [Chaenocephalus aceratus]